MTRFCVSLPVPASILPARHSCQRFRALSLHISLAACFLAPALTAANAALAAQAPKTATQDTTTATPLTAQRASYDLALAESSGGNTLSATGSMTYNVRDTCTAWSTQQHLDIQSATRSGGAVAMESDYTTLESKDGRHLIFRTVQKSNNTILQTISGEATLDAKNAGGVVHYEKPLKKTLKLPPGTLFPMAHTAAIISAAEHGTSNFSPLLFDGTGEDGAQYTYITAFHWDKPESAPPFPALQNMAAGRVHVAFFGHAQDAILPDYEIGMRYFANGVSDNLDMDFGDFRMAGTLRSLTIPPKPRHC
ncbi:cell envelope integrity EipB family protein [Acetobacter senegalensis]|uniref:cell envelope integrity EipB family protein n=1 Tax=Acetobacter senegalensis TaxID=446692 RepID=UPI001EDBF9DD|nr:cell envelope integrity EipB family protein [Acetobacter senegalensis]MCG4261264.1 cell envelope integrity EipB family protein [Acetobacter senegalensis]